jgi:hypothetical protein
VLGETRPYKAIASNSKVRCISADYTVKVPPHLISLGLSRQGSRLWIRSVIAPSVKHTRRAWCSVQNKASFVESRRNAGRLSLFHVPSAFQLRVAAPPNYNESFARLSDRVFTLNAVDNNTR